MPTFWVLKNNEKYTGASVFFVDEGIDSGPIISQQKIKIGNMTPKDLIIKSKKIGMELISDAIKKINNNNYTIIENNKQNSTYYSFPTKYDVKAFKKNGKYFFLNILTFDIEEWFHILDNYNTKSESDWLNYESRIHRNMEIIFNIIDKHNVRATFFIVGWIAEKYPEIVKQISDRGFSDRFTYSYASISI